jgi:hypothetical protein
LAAAVAPPARRAPPAAERVPEIAALAGHQMAGPLLRSLGLNPDHEEVRVEAIAPSPRTASLLYGGSRDRPTLRVSRRFCDGRGRALALAIGRCTFPGATFSVIRPCGRVPEPGSSSPRREGAPDPRAASTEPEMPF